MVTYMSLPFLSLLMSLDCGSFINNSFLKMSLILLTLWLFNYMMTSNNMVKGSLLSELTHTLLLVIVMFFVCQKSITFYVLFELSLIPTLMMVFFFGYQPEKLQASMYLLLYTVFSSLPLLLVFISNKTFMNFINHSFMWWYTVVMTLGFSVKTPLYLVHVWLPKAHVEAPIAGSMVLAGVLLKLGSYGFIIFCPFFYNPVLMVYIYLSILGAIYCSIICLRNHDMKSLIAYSSVVHMGVVTIGVVSGYEIGYKSAIMMVIAHGVCSPFLFYLAYNLYCSSHSRVVASNKGSISLPAMIFFCFLLFAINMGVPPSINLWSEVIMFVTLLGFMKYTLFFLFVIAFLGVIYNLFMYIVVSQSKESFSLKMEAFMWPFLSATVLSFMLFAMVNFF